LTSSNRRPVDQAELEVQLADQFRFLETSAAAFDSGFEGEAKRLAVTLRVLFHDTKNSHSLLGLLGRKAIECWSLAFPPTPGSLIPHGSLVAGVFGPQNKPRYVAPLDDVPEKDQIPLDKWWTTSVFLHPDGGLLSRRDLVLAAANQDGGAHVDPALDETYARFSRDNALGWTYPDQGGQTPLSGATQAAIRQIAHEVLKTLKPGYSKMPTYPPNAVITGGPSVVKVPNSPATRTGPKVRVNDPCPCGSGRKYKKCCGR